MIVLGVDPGTRHLGWGVVEAKGNRLRHVAHGVIDTDTKLPLAARLVQIDEELTRVVDAHRPDIGSVETLFFHKDAQAAAKLGHARGVVLLTLARANVEVFEYPPAQVKRVVTGKGQADKRQVAMMIRALLALEAVPKPDAADALAIAVTHHRRAPLAEALERARTVGDNPALAQLLERGGYRPGRKRGARRRRPPHDVEETGS